MNFVVPWEGELSEGTYELDMPLNAYVIGKTYAFVKWADGITKPTRIISLDSNKYLKVIYRLVPKRMKITMRGGYRHTKGAPSYYISGNSYIRHVTK